MELLFLCGAMRKNATVDTDGDENAGPCETTHCTGSKFVLDKLDLLLFSFPSENSLVTLLSAEVFTD